MLRLFGLLLALLFAVMPTVDMVCRALCTPGASAEAVPACHEVAPATADGMVVPAISCQRDAAAALVPGDASRGLVAPAPVVTVRASIDRTAAAACTADRSGPPVRPRPTQAFPSSIVLRI